MFGLESLEKILKLGYFGCVLILVIVGILSLVK